MTSHQPFIMFLIEFMIRVCPHSFAQERRFVFDVLLYTLHGQHVLLEYHSIGQCVINDHMQRFS